MELEKINAAVELLKPINTPELIAALQHICENRGYSAVIGLAADNNLYGAVGGKAATTIFTKLIQAYAKQMDAKPEDVALRILVSCIECSVGCRDEKTFEPTDMPKEKVVDALQDHIAALVKFLLSDHYKIEVES